MLMAHPAVLAHLVEEYEMVAQAHAADPARREPARQRMEDLVYTLCVSTGTRDIESALTAARERLRTAWLGEGEAAARDHQVLSGASK
ncbi:DUF5133 domain-containing protein [Streptomyces subrutilus]|uniref:DUF5133 domain-containing protein n=1 Tax=Streptomyces subrutilus TaxID=36818 RepID=A0A1E5PM31_9ACTN|nr:DUF5133 domain-containing protein [Streptomyces subrutilus]OEJ30422.1 hypothetical protein BGK67_02800 [Streptomyces subrutilus]